MKSDWLEAFLAFSQTLNFTKAAERLYISQPALHVKIKKLAEYVGRDLYQKSGRNLQLTAEGLKLQAFAQEQADQAQQFLAQLRNEETTNQVCLSAGGGAYLYLLGPALSSFTASSSAALSIKVGNQPSIIEDVLSGRAHLGITPLDAQHPDLMCKPFTRVGQVLVMQKNHPLALKRQVNLKSLQGSQLIVPPKQAPHRVLINRLLSDAQVDWSASIEVMGWELMIKFVKQGLGMAIINEYCSLPAGLKAKPLKEFPTIQFYLIKRRHAVKNPSVDDLEARLLHFKEKWRPDAGKFH